MPEEILEFLLRTSTVRYEHLRSDHADDLRAGRCPLTNRQRMLYYAAEVCELRARLAGALPNPCY